MTDQDEALESQVDWLAHDIDMLIRLIKSDPRTLAPAFVNESPASANLHHASLAMFWSALDLAFGAHTLIVAQLRVPLIPVQRALLEATSGLKHLVSCDDPAQEAAIKLAYELQHGIEEGQLDPGTLGSWSATLSQIPADAVQEAQRRLRKGRGWSGVSARRRLERTGMGEYSVYAHLSEEAHGSLTHHQVGRISVDGKPYVRIGRPFHAAEAEFAANFSRRLLLIAYTSLGTVFTGLSRDLVTADPFKWLERQP